MNWIQTYALLSNIIKSRNRFVAYPNRKQTLFYVPWTVKNRTHGPALNHWGRVTHICVSELTTTGSDNGLSPGRRQAIIWSNAGILLNWTIGTNFSEILSEIDTFSFKQMRLKMSGKWRPYCLVLYVLTHWDQDKMAAIFQTFSNGFSGMKMYEFRLTSHWSFVPRGPINNIPTLLQVMTWRRPGDKPLSEPIMVRLTTHICVTRPQWVKKWLCYSGHRVALVVHRAQKSVPDSAGEWPTFLPPPLESCSGTANVDGPKFLSYSVDQKLKMSEMLLAIFLVYSTSGTTSGKKVCRELKMATILKIFKY